MRHRSSLAVLFLSAIAASATPLSAPPPAARSGLSAGVTPLKDWTRLRYTTSKLLIFTGELTLTKSSSADTLAVRMESEAKLFGSPFANSWSVSTMDGRTHRPLEFLEVRPSKRAERWSFRGDGVTRTTLKPRTKSKDEPIEKWRVTKTETLTAPQSPRAPSGGASSSSAPSSNPSPRPDPATQRSTANDPPHGTAHSSAAGGASYETPPAGDPSRWVHDYIAMIVRLAELPLGKVGDEATVRVSTSRGPVPMRIRAVSERTTRRTLTDLATGGRRTVDLRELRLRVTPLAGSPAETKGFLDMEGETELWVEARTRTLIEISGNVPNIPGRVVITLAGYR